jgi:type IX secretion system PorP/SprF family membrane protein
MERLLRTYAIWVVMASSLLVEPLSGQQDAMYTHYMYNTLAVNPAYAGSRDALTATLLHRSQWVSFPGAPVTQTLTVHGPAFDRKIGLGLSVVNDKAGPLKQTSVAIDANYIMYVNDEDRLAFGIKGALDFFRGEFANIQTPDDDMVDNVFGVDVGGMAKPNFGTGVYYYKPRMYLGLSVPSLLKSTYATGDDDQIVSYERERHFYLIGGAVFDLNFDWMLKPTGFLKVVPGAPVEFDITPTFIYQEKYNIGVMYRSADAVGVQAGIMLNEQLLASYSFDWSFTNPTGKYNGGSHELMLRYDFIYKRRRRIKSPRYF